MIIDKLKNIELHKKYAFWAVIFGIAFSLLIPLRTVPDEPLHIAQAYSISNQLMGTKVNINGSVAERSDDFTNYEYTDHYSWDLYVKYWKSLLSPIENETMVPTGQKEISTRYPYVLAALGITIGRLFHAGTGITLNLGRLFNLLFFAACGALALKLIPFGRELLFVILLLPMTIQQGMSFSYDVMVMALSFLITALFIRDNMSENLTKKQIVKSVVIQFILAALIFPIKSHAYVLFFLLPVYTLIHHFLNAETKRKILIAVRIFLLLAVVAGIIFWIFTALHPSFIPEKTSYVAWAKEDGYTLSYVLHHQLKIMYAMFLTLNYKFDYYFVTTVIGTALGPLTLPLPNSLNYVFLVLLVLASLHNRDQEIKLSRNIKILFFWIFIVTVLAIFLGMIIAWTPISSNYVLGIQGRYFLPVLFMAWILLDSPKVTISERLKEKVVPAAIIMDIITVLFILGYGYIYRI